LFSFFHFMRGCDLSAAEQIDESFSLFERWNARTAQDRETTAPSFAFNCYGQATLPTNMYVAAG
jgi:hypothetical protein